MLFPLHISSDSSFNAWHITPFHSSAHRVVYVIYEHYTLFPNEKKTKLGNRTGCTHFSFVITSNLSFTLHYSIDDLLWLIPPN